MAVDTFFLFLLVVPVVSLLDLARSAVFSFDGGFAAKGLGAGRLLLRFFVDVSCTSASESSAVTISLSDCSPNRISVAIGPPVFRAPLRPILNFVASSRARDWTVMSDMGFIIMTLRSM